MAFLLYIDMKKFNSFNPLSDWNVHSEELTSKVQVIYVKKQNSALKA